MTAEQVAKMSVRDVLLAITRGSEIDISSETPAGSTVYIEITAAVYRRIFALLEDPTI
jgi:hypothetical protein